VAHELAAPMSAIDSMTVISNEGASALPKAVSTNMVQLNQIIKDTIGLDLSALASTITADASETVPSTAVATASADGSGRASRNGEGSRH
jgi:flotillin